MYSQSVAEYIIAIIGESAVNCLVEQSINVPHLADNLENALMENAVGHLSHRAVREAALFLRQQTATKKSTTGTTAKTKTKEFQMEIKNVTYVNGIDATTLSDNDLFQHISATKAELKKLRDLGVSGPAFVHAENELKSKIDELTTIVNGRYPEASADE